MRPFRVLGGTDQCRGKAKRDRPTLGRLCLASSSRTSIPFAVVKTPPCTGSTMRFFKSLVEIAARQIGKQLVKSEENCGRFDTGETHCAVHLGLLRSRDMLSISCRLPLGDSGKKRFWRLSVAESTEERTAAGVGAPVSQSVSQERTVERFARSVCRIVSTSFLLLSARCLLCPRVQTSFKVVFPH